MVGTILVIFVIGIMIYVSVKEKNETHKSRRIINDFDDYYYIGVKFDEVEKTHYFLSSNGEINVGDRVEVPGKTSLANVSVVSVRRYRGNNQARPCNPESMKYVIRRVSSGKVYTYVGVKFPNLQKVHYYLSERDNINTGDIVRVPVHNGVENASVVSVARYHEADTKKPADPDRMKHVLHKLKSDKSYVFVGVKFHGTGKVYYYLSRSQRNIHVGDRVIVQGKRNLEIALVDSVNAYRDIDPQKPYDPNKMRYIKKRIDSEHIHHFVGVRFYENSNTYYYLSESSDIDIKDRLIVQGRWSLENVEVVFFEKYRDDDPAKPYDPLMMKYIKRKIEPEHLYTYVGVQFDDDSEIDYYLLSEFRTIETGFRVKVTDRTDQLGKVVSIKRYREDDPEKPFDPLKMKYIKNVIRPKPIPTYDHGSDIEDYRDYEYYDLNDFVDASDFDPHVHADRSDYADVDYPEYDDFDDYDEF